MLHSEESSCLLPGQTDTGAVDHRVRTGKIDIFKNAEMLGRRSAMAGITSDAVRIHGHNFARCHIAEERCTHCVQCAGFRSKHHSAVRTLAHAQRTEPVRVAGSDQLGGGGNDQRIRTIDPIHRGTDSRLDGAAAQPLLHDDIGNDLGVGCGMKNGALLF